MRSDPIFRPELAKWGKDSSAKIEKCQYLTTCESQDNFTILTELSHLRSGLTSAATQTSFTEIFLTKILDENITIWRNTLCWQEIWVLQSGEIDGQSIEVGRLSLTRLIIPWWTLLQTNMYTSCWQYFISYVCVLNIVLIIFRNAPCGQSTYQGGVLPSLDWLSWASRGEFTHQPHFIWCSVKYWEGAFTQPHYISFDIPHTWHLCHYIALHCIKLHYFTLHYIR